MLILILMLMLMLMPTTLNRLVYNTLQSIETCDDYNTRVSVFATLLIQKNYFQIYLMLFLFVHYFKFCFKTSFDFFQAIR